MKKRGRAISTTSAPTAGLSRFADVWLDEWIVIDPSVLVGSGTFHVQKVTGGNPIRPLNPLASMADMATTTSTTIAKFRLPCFGIDFPQEFDSLCFWRVDLNRRFIISILWGGRRIMFIICLGQM